jgi:RHS repeat-associated protein
MMSRALVRLAAFCLSLGAATVAGAQGSETVTYYHTDAVGSVRVITDASGQVIARYDTLPFGEEIPNEFTVDDVRKFAGKEHDYETDFDYFGARYYAAVNGRFTTVDPLLDIEKATLDPQQWNRYAYVRNSPFVHVDRDGRALDVALDVVFIANDVRTIAQQGLTVGNGVSLAGNVVGAVVPFATGVGAGAKAGYELATSGRFLEEAAQWATRLGKNTERILEDGLARGAKFRVPDLLDEARRVIGEVKDRSYVSLSKQLDDFFDYAKQTKSDFGLFIGERTRLSKPLLQRIRDSGARVYRLVDRTWQDVTDEVLAALNP